MSNDEKSEVVKEKPWVLPVLFLGVVSLWILTPFVVSYFFPEDWGKRGQFGDLFGVVNSLFSGLAFAALVFTIHLQRKELALQRNELKLQRNEMIQSRGELTKQVKVQKAQFVASVANLQAQSILVTVEALKYEGEGASTYQRQAQMKKMLEQADQLKSLSNALAALDTKD